MIDTISATVVPDARLDIGVFDSGEVVEWLGEAKPRRDKFWLNVGGLAPTVTYWRHDRPEDTGLLKVVFSVPKLCLAAGDGDWNVGEVGIDMALDLVDLFLRSYVSEGLPSIREWRAQRVDYAWNWRVSSSSDYLDYLKTLSFRSAERTPYKHGVMWSSGTRTVKFYARDGNVLRFEVTNFRDGCRTLAHWFACERTVGELARLGRAVWMLSWVMDGLGLRPDVPLVGGDELLVSRLCEAFGDRNVGVARHVLWCISTYGTAAFREHEVVSRGTYYAWRRKLLDAGFVLSGGGDAPVVLPALTLPVCEVVDGEKMKFSLPARNLDGENFRRLHSSKKIPGLSERLGISANAPHCRWLDLV